MNFNQPPQFEKIDLKLSSELINKVLKAAESLGLQHYTTTARGVTRTYDLCKILKLRLEGASLDSTAEKLELTTKSRRDTIRIKQNFALNMLKRKGLITEEEYQILQKFFGKQD